MSHWKWIVIFMLPLLLLAGCNANTGTGAANDMKNVEERDYATIVVISTGTEGKAYHMDLGVAQEKKVGEDSQREEVSSFDCDSLDELAWEYQLVKGKDLSLAHLKVIFLGQGGEVQQNGQMYTQTMKIPEISWNLEEMQELLRDLDANPEIAKTCPVLKLEAREEFLEYLEEAEEPVGTYVSNLVSAAERRGRDIPWLKDYLRAVREGDTLFTYVLEPVAQGWKLRCSRKMEGTQYTGYE